MPPESHSPALEDLLARAWAAVYGDDPRQAAVPLRAALCLAPECGEAWAALAELPEADLPDPVNPATLWGRAAACEPNERRFALAWGQALIATAPGAAAAIFAKLATQRPDDAAALGGLGRALAAAGRAAAALESLREAAALAPGDGDLIRDLATLYIECGDPLAAAEALAPFTGPACDAGAALYVLAQAWAALGERDKALKALTRAEALGAAETDDLRAALTTGEDDAPPDAAYVRALFDRYAERFDKELVEKLDYRGPQLVAAAASRALPGRRGLRVLDLGCGTGLAGETLRPLASELHGVDLSSGMVAQARKRGVYDGLIVGGLVETLQDSPAAWDLLAAADVLMYLGRLEPAFAAAAAALRPGGALVFTVEAMNDEEIAQAGSHAPHLRPSRRYAHAPEYLRAALETAGLTLMFIESAVLRMDRRQPVTGWVVAAAQINPRRPRHRQGGAGPA